MTYHIIRYLLEEDLDLDMDMDVDVDLRRLDRLG